MAGRSAAPAVQESAPFTKREQGESLNAIGGKPPELTDEQIMALSDDEVRALAKADGIDIEANAARWRGFLEGFRKGSARGTRYVGNAVCAPTRVLFANGRIVEIRDGALFVDRNEDEAARVFGESTPSTVNTDTK
jgi:hypothetical protein